MDNEILYFFGTSGGMRMCSGRVDLNKNSGLFDFDKGWEAGHFEGLMHSLVTQFPQYIPLLNNFSKDVCIKIQHIAAIMPEIRKSVMVEIERYFENPPPYRYEKFLILGYPIALGDFKLRSRGWELKRYKGLLDFIQYAMTHDENCWLRFYQGFDFSLAQRLFWEIKQDESKSLEEAIQTVGLRENFDNGELLDLMTKNGLICRNKMGDLFVTDRGKLFGA